MGRSGDRVETLAMRISAEEHARLKSLAEKEGLTEAAMVRLAINNYCLSKQREIVFPKL